MISLRSVACHIFLESSRLGLQFFFRPHFNRRSSHKIMGLQSCGSPNFGNFKTRTWESRDKLTFECWPRDQAQKVLQGGRWWFPTSLGCGESCEYVFAHGLYLHQKCFNYALTNMLFGMCMSVWIIELLITCPSPHFRALAHPSTPEMLWVRELALTPSPFIVFTFRLHVESIKELGGCVNFVTI
jgi:hypothetical protein